MELSKRIVKRREILDQIEKLKLRADQEGVAIIAEMRSKHLDRAPGGDFVALLREVPVWQSFDKLKAEKDFPMDRYPELYSIDYQKLNGYLRRGSKRRDLIKKYLPQTNVILRIQKAAGAKPRRTARKGSLTS
jgi:hypothetical protein